MNIEPVIGAMLGGWEIVLILGAALVLGLAFIAAVIVLAICCWRNQKKTGQVVPPGGTVSH